MHRQTVFKVGDRVRHKHGGPVMEIVRPSGGHLVCTWFSQGKMQQVPFEETALVPAGTSN